ncbi:MAG: hypothetical protein HOC27_06965 [Phycisphaerae bacterium]|nr:hypothetical protein [Phycisphaerae bacterium]
MDKRSQQWIARAIATLLLVASTAVASSTPSNFEFQLQELQQQLDDAAIANKAVRLELDEARDTYYSDEWLNEERADSVMALVQDILADSDQRVNLYGDGSMMGWNDGFHLSSADGLFGLNIGGLMQQQFMSRWQGTDTASISTYDKWSHSFGMSRTELNFGGHVYGKGTRYYFELGWGRNDPYSLTGQSLLMSPRLWDAWIEFHLNNETSVKIGQFTLPFTREGLVSAPYQMAVFSSLVEYRMGLEQSQGVELDWQSDDRKFALAVSNGSPALFQVALWGATDPTPPWSALSSDTLYSITMRHEWKLLGNWDQFNQFTSPPGSERGVMIGIAGHRQNIESNSPEPIGGFPDGVFWGVTGDITMQFDGASLFASVIYERMKDFSPFLPRINLLAFVAQGSTYITNQTELFARWESGGPDEEALGADIMQIATIGVNHYVDGQDMKFTADLGFSFGEISATMANSMSGWAIDARRRNQMVLRTQLQLMF